MTTRKRPVARKAAKHYEVVYDGDHSPVTFDARTLTIPALSVIAVVGAFVWGTWIILSERDRIEKRISSTVVAIERLAAGVERLASLQATLSADRWTRTQHELFCSKAEVINKNWKCPQASTARPPVNPARLSNTERRIRDEILQSLRKVNE